MEVDESRLREMMNIINAYVDGLIGRECPDYEDICQDALLKSLPYLNSMSRYTVPTIFKRNIKDSIYRNIVKNYVHDEISIEDIDISYPAGKHLLEKMMKDDVDKVITTLTPREEDTITKYFYDQKSMSEIARDFNVTLTRVRQILSKALRKLRKPVRSDTIRDYKHYTSDPEFKQVQKVSDEE